MSSRSHGEDRGEQLRALLDCERDVLAILLTARFPGRTALLAQAVSVKARRIDENGSLALAPEAQAPKATVTRRIPVEAEADDRDGVTVHILLHVLDGFMNELEIYREDSAPVQRAPAPQSLRLIVL